MPEMPSPEFCLKRLEQFGLGSQRLRRGSVGDKGNSMPTVLYFRQNSRKRIEPAGEQDDLVRNKASTLALIPKLRTGIAN